MKDQLVEKLQNIIGIPAVSGQESLLVDYLAKQLAAKGVVIIDGIGNLNIKIKGRTSGPKLLIAAHLDQIGAVVKYIDEQGFIYFEKIGGTLESLLLARKVRVENINGVIGVKPGHYQTALEKSQVPTIDQMYIDIGVNSKQEVEALGIEIGSPITYHDQLMFFQNQNLFAGAAVDNRAGCAVLWQVIENVADQNFGGELNAVFTVQEEVGLRGAGVAAFNLQADFALALDTIPCGGTPDIKVSELNTQLGQGPVLANVSGRGGVFSSHPQLKQILKNTAAKNKIPYQLTVFSGGNNDASAMAIAGRGTPAASVTIPRRYSHSPVEMADLSDLKNTTMLLEQIVRDMAKFPPLSFI